MAARGAIRTIRLTLSAAEIRRGIRSVNESLTSIDKTTKKVQKSVNLLTKMYGALFAFGMVKSFGDTAIQMAKTAEATDLMSTKLSQLTGEATAFQDVFEGTRRVGADLEEMTKVVGRFAVATNKAFSTREMTKWAEGMVLAARSVGSSQQEINSAMIQWSQALGAGALQGEEFRSVNESLVPLMDEIAKVMGVARSELKGLAKDGKITTDVMVASMQNLHESMAEFEGLTDTLSAKLNNLNSSWTVFMGNLMGSDNIIADTVDVIDQMVNKINELFEIRALAEASGKDDTWGTFFSAYFADMETTTGMLKEMRAEQERVNSGEAEHAAFLSILIQRQEGHVSVLRNLKQAQDQLMTAEERNLVTEAIKNETDAIVKLNFEIANTQSLRYLAAGGEYRPPPGDKPYDKPDDKPDDKPVSSGIDPITQEITRLKKEMRTSEEVLFDYIEKIEMLEDNGLDATTAFRALDQAFKDYESTLDKTAKEGGPLDTYIKSFDRLVANVDLLPDKVAFLTSKIMDGGAAADIAQQQLDGLIGKQTEAAEVTDDWSQSMEDALAASFVDGIGQMSDAIVDFAITGEQSFGEMTASILADIAKMILQMTIMNALKSAFGGSGGLLAGVFGNAQGNAFQGGNVIPFARGGVVSEPTIFPMAQGIGLMGESGPEAILPLSRDPAGNLGVKSQGAQNIVVNINGVTDFGSFQRNQAQVTNSIQGQFAMANRNL